jgi:F-type H+-transporting ATPase subunit c
MLDGILTLAELTGSAGMIGIGIGVGLVVLGAGIGIGNIGGNAAAGIARQPEASGKIQTAMIIAAALIEGLAFVALIFASFILPGK